VSASHIEKMSLKLKGKNLIFWVAASVGSVAVWLFAYRGLLDYNPLARSKIRLHGIEGAFFSPADSDPTLIFVLTGFLLFQRRNAILQSFRSRPPLAGAITLLAGSSGLHLWAMYVGAPELLIPSLGLMLLGGGTLLCGARGGRILLLPAVFLMLAYRPPGLWINGIIHPLQRLVVYASGETLDFVGIESLTSGDMIAALGRVFQVIESCAGLRSIETLLMASIIYGEIMGCPRRIRFLLIAASPLVALVTNELRVLTMIFNPDSAFASVHTLQGIAMIVVGVLIISGLDRIFERWIPVGVGGLGDSPTSDGHEPIPFVLVLPRIAALVGLLLALGITSWATGTWTPARSTLPALSTFPASFAGWEVAGRRLDREFTGSVGYSQWIRRSYTHQGREVTLFVASNDRLNPRSSLLSRRNALLGRGWQKHEDTGISLLRDPTDANRRAEISIQSTPFPDSSAPAMLVYSWYEGIGSLPQELIRSALALDRGPLRRPGRAIVVRVSTPIPAAGVHAAEETLDEFLVLINADLARIIVPDAEGEPI
jgi:exosortase